MCLDRSAADRCLDVRTIDGEPFGEIVDALDDLGSDDSLLLINSFEPRPLYQVLEERGFTYETTEQASDVWYVMIRRA